MPDENLPFDAQQAVVFDWQWRLDATPEALWPLVSDTNRINRLASMAPASFRDAPHPDGGTDRTGESKMLGLGVSWDERPFEWLYPSGFSVVREFHNGVLRAYRSTVTLAPDGDGTALSHRVELLPRLGPLRGFIEREGPKQRAHWDHAYRAIEAYLTGRGPWPFATQGKTRVAWAMRREARAIEAAIEVESPDPEIERLLFAHALGEADAELMPIKPFVLADRWASDRHALLEACLVARRRGLLAAQWGLLCPHCRGAKGNAARRADLGRDVYCGACNIQFSAIADDAVELTFTVDPRYRRLKEASYCVGGPGATPHVFFQAAVEGLTQREIALSLPPGGYRLRGPRIKGVWNFTYHGGALPAEELPIAHFGPDGFSEGPAHLYGPKLALWLSNQGNAPLQILVETKDWRDDCLTLAYLREHPALLAALDEAFA